MEEKYIVTDFNGCTLAKFDEFWRAAEYAREYARKHDIYIYVVKPKTEEFYVYDKYGNLIESSEYGWI